MAQELCFLKAVVLNSHGPDMSVFGICRGTVQAHVHFQFCRRLSCQTFLHISLVQEHFHVAARFCKCIHMFAGHVTRIIGLIR